MSQDTPPSSDNGSSNGSDKPTGIGKFWAELKRRKVMRVAITYIVASIAIIEFASVTFEGFGIPVWAFRFVMLMLFMGFPIAIILAWAFELTPGGIKTTKHVDEERGDVPVSEKQQRKRNWFTFLFGAAVPTVIFGALAVFFYIRSGGDTERPDGELSVAVLPLDNLSPDPENAFFADGVQEDILTNLSQIDELRVIARTSTLGYRDTTKKIKEIGVELGVRYLVEGSVRRAGKQVRVTVQLIDAQIDEHIWAQNYTRDLDDIFEVQSAIAKEIAGKLQVAISPEAITRIERIPTDNQEAYDLYIKSRQLFDDFESTYADYIVLLEEAVTLDPEFAEAWGRLALWYSVSWARDYRTDQELLAKANHAYSEAKRFGPDLPNTIWTQGLLTLHQQWDVEASIKLILEAFAIDPSFDTGLYSLGGRYILLGRLAEAQHHMEAAIRVNPLSQRANERLFQIYQLRGMWDRALALIQGNLRHPNSVDFWKIRLAKTKYLQTGDQKAFVAGIEAIPGFWEHEHANTWKALVLRDYSEALLHLKELDSEVSFPFLGRGILGRGTIYGGISMSIEHTGLLAALIGFELEEKETSITETDKAKDYLQSITGVDPLAWPSYWSNLAICYALEGDREQMNSTIARVRELTGNKNWRYQYQAHCEMLIAICYLVLGDDDKAIATLEAASKMDGPIFLNRELDLWFIFDRLRDDPRFDALLEE